MPIRNISQIDTSDLFLEIKPCYIHSFFDHDAGDWKFGVSTEKVINGHIYDNFLVKEFDSHEELLKWVYNNFTSPKKDLKQ